MPDGLEQHHATPPPNKCRKETAHIDLRHVDDIDQYRVHRCRMEVEAESVAFIVASLTGV